VRQRGAALLVVMVMVLLATLLAAGAARTAWFNELITGTDVDHQRAFENAQALLRDAEFDIRGRHPNGAPCREGAGFEGSCRARGMQALAAGQPWFPQEGRAEFEPVHAWLASRSPSCAQGICVADQVMPEFWRQTKGELDKMKAFAARYGEFTGAPPMQASNPLLTTKGWYWVEVLPFDTHAPAPAGAEVLAPDPENPFVFRITTLAEGRKPSTRAVLQALFVWKKVDS
jgi:type IV pilus assembly protein PilX